MESNKEVDPLDQAIQRVLEVIKALGASTHNPLRVRDNDQLSLKKLVSQLQVAKEVCTHRKSKGRQQEKTAKAILKELKQVKRQNLVTQCLVSALIVVTVAWELSELSLFLRVKDGLGHPFRYLGSLVGNIFKISGGNEKDENAAENGEENTEEAESTLPIPGLPKLPDLGLLGH